jgi:hypothetical protein
VEDDRAAAVLLGREAAGQQVGRRLALGAGQAQVVAGLGADAPDDQPDEHDQAEPDRHDHDRAVGAQITKPVQDTGHCDDPFPRPDQRGRGVRASRQAKHRFVVGVNGGAVRVDNDGPRRTAGQPVEERP